MQYRPLAGSSIHVHVMWCVQKQTLTLATANRPPGTSNARARSSARRSIGIQAGLADELTDSNENSSSSPGTKRSQDENLSFSFPPD